MAADIAAIHQGSHPALSLRSIQVAAERLKGQIHRTPCWESETFSRLCGGRVWLKYENLQKTGSYKLRGALNRILTIPEEQRAQGVIAASAGNHAQGVAVAAALAATPATIVMPRLAPMAKVDATRSYGARVILHGEAFDEAHAEAMRIAALENLTYIHPFDDVAIMAGQGTVTLELLEDAPNLDMLVIPIGGGGLIAGCAVAARALRPSLQIIGVQAERANATYLAFHDQYSGPLTTLNTIADGLATRSPGVKTLPIIREYVDDVVTVSEGAIAEAVTLLIERAKTVAEPAGAAALAALLSGAVTLRGRAAGVVLSGGNVDPNTIDRILQYGLGVAGRHLRLRTWLADRPGGLARVAGIVAEQGANIFEVLHHRLGASRSVSDVDLELTLEVRNYAHGDQVVAALNAAGFDTQIIRTGAR